MVPMSLMRRLPPYFLIILAFGLVGCARTKTVELPPLPKKPETVQMTIYSPVSDGLVGEVTEIPKKDYTPKKVLKLLIMKEGAPPNSGPYEPFLPSQTKILGVEVKDGLATVNFTRDVLNVEGSEKMQRYAVFAIVKTLTEFPKIKQVKFQVEGRESGKIGERNIEDWWGKVTLKEQPWQL